MTAALSPESETAPWRATVLTIFPEMFPGPLGCSLAGRALEDGIWSLETVDIRGFARDKHGSVDDAPFGGGPGMVMRPDIVADALEAKTESEGAVIYMSPRGRALDQARVREIASDPSVTLLCGRFEGIDARVMDEFEIDEVSLGDFVLSGGEPAAIALIDACVRLLPGVVGQDESLAEESFERGLLEYPQYTRPQSWRDRAVPEILLSGHHEKVKAWRQDQAEKITRERRPDLWQRYVAERATLKE
ncbi:MAG: tRNA (guanosine(37)-N1)-methyltransferase TrmD [Pseudomonadota bacterium]|nr:tRNA (guanosine(37)-N1)-methyltransferase TrmD [Pseudomonadota bacterium]